jgi:hypothetical protein
MQLLKNFYIKNTNYEAYYTTNLNRIPALNVTNTNNKTYYTKLQIFKHKNNNLRNTNNKAKTAKYFSLYFILMYIFLI